MKPEPTTDMFPRPDGWLLYVLVWGCRCECRYVGITQVSVADRIAGKHNDDVEVHKKLLHTKVEIACHINGMREARHAEKVLIKSMQAAGLKLLNRKQGRRPLAKAA